jgi:uncharacterized OB-fold protein
MADTEGSGPLDAISRGYWDGVARNELVVQQCGKCGTLRHYPQLLCRECQSLQFEHVSVEMTGTVHSWTISEHSFDKEIAPDVPYTLVTVDICEGVRVLGRFEDAAILSIGLPVTLNFEANPRGNRIPVFRSS